MMKLISWNVCGLISPSKHRMLKKRITREKADIVMIQETKCYRETMGKIAKNTWKECEVEEIDSEEASGSLEILWDPTKWKLYLVVLFPRILTMRFVGIVSQSQGFILNA
jgi:hypothetical protein